MTHTVAIIEGKTVLAVDYTDEGVQLQQQIIVDGTEQKAENYLPFFDRDCRRNFADLFPQPVATEGRMMV